MGRLSSNARVQTGARPHRENTLEESLPRVDLRVAERAGDLTAGPNASGRLGDWVIDNGLVRAVIQGLPGGSAFALSGGSIIDFVTVDGEGHRGRDELGQVFTLLGEFPRQLVFDRVTASRDRDHGATLTFAGSDPRTPGLVGETRYKLLPNRRYLYIQTTLTHGGNTPTTVRLADAIQWGSADHWLQGYGFDVPRQTTTAWLSGVGALRAYAYVSDDFHSLSGPNGGAWSNPSRASVTLSPGGTVTWSRRLSVADRPSVADALMATEMPLPSNAVVVTATGPDGPAPGVQVQLHGERQRFVMFGSTDSSGRVRLPVEPGNYTVEVRAPGRQPHPQTIFTVSVTSGRDSNLRVSLSARSTLSVSIVRENSPSPARVLFHGLGDTADPMLGPIGDADGARNGLVVGASGETEVSLAPGRYSVTATRGPEDTLATTEVTIAEGAREHITLTLHRAVELGRYVCGDFHQHQAPSLDSAMALRERARADAAEGLRVVATTDHNVAGELSRAVQAEGLEGSLLALSGVEVSTDIAQAPIGHINLYPVPVDHTQSRGGMPEFFELDQPSFLAAARRWAPEAIVQVNHPRAPGPTGMFGLIGFDATTGRARAPFDPHFDTIEIWNGRWQRSVDQGVADWLALLRLGARVTAVGNSDSHAVVTQEAGWPRTCLAVPDPRRFTVTDVRNALRETHDVFVTAGPTFTVLGPDHRPALGRSYTAGARGAVAFRVRVDSPVWAAADSLEWRDAGGRSHPVAVRWSRDDRHSWGEATVNVARSAGLAVFIARGSEPISVLVGPPSIVPMAISNPVWVR